MNLFRIEYVEHFNPDNEFTAYILSKGLPRYKEIVKRINMLDYCGKRMTDEDYKDFVIDLGNYTKYNIENVKEVKYMKFNTIK